MLRIEWRDTWLNTLIDAGISPTEAKNAFSTMYGLDGFDNTKNPAHLAHEALELIAKEKEAQS